LDLDLRSSSKFSSTSLDNALTLSSVVVMLLVAYFANTVLTVPILGVSVAMLFKPKWNDKKNRTNRKSLLSTRRARAAGKNVGKPTRPVRWLGLN